jgi:tRNA (mo5U34)-methyltransferase
MKTKVARFVSRLRVDPSDAMVELRNRIERKLIRWDGAWSLRTVNIPREPFSVTDREIMGIHWVHRIELPDGTVTPGDWNTGKYMKRLRLPASLTGKTVLDVGTWDGLYAFEAEKRDARRVLATDHYCWSGPGWGTRAGFDLAHRLLGSKVEAKDIDIPDISPQTVGLFDVVLFLGVLYHLPEPFLALERVASVTKELLILETMVDLTFMRQPALSFQRGRSQPVSLYRHWRWDDGTWFVPNEGAVVTMLEQVGFRKVERIFPRLAVPSRIAHFLNALVPFFNVQKNYRMVFHAWK